MELYEKEYGIILTSEKAEEEFSKLCQLYRLVYLTSIPLPKRADLQSAHVAQYKPSTCYNSGATRKINS
jgi:hypothetical protein